MRSKLFILFIMMILIMMLGFVYLALTQDVITFSKEENSDDVIKDEQGRAVRARVFIQSKDGSPVIIDKTEQNDSGDKNIKLDKQNRDDQDNQDKKFRRQEFREEKKTEKFGRNDMNNGEDKKKQFGVMQAGKPNEQMPANVPSQFAQNAPQKGNAPDDSGLQRYINAIVSKNLFLPLGSSKEVPKPSYALTAVISGETGGPSSKAIIEQLGTQRTFYASKGDTVGDVKVTDIEEWSAKLDRSGEQINLKLGEGTQSGARGGGGPGGGGPSGGQKFAEGGGQKPNFRQGGASSGGQKDFNPDMIPPFVKQMLEQRGISIEELKNNPELQQKLREEFQQQRSRGGGGPGGDKPMRVEMQ